MAELIGNGRAVNKLLVILSMWILQFVIGYLALSTLFQGWTEELPSVLASADTRVQNKIHNQSSGAKDYVEQQCADCRLTSQSIEELLRKPRQMDAYGQMPDQADLNKLKKGVCKEIVSDTQREGCRSFFYSNLPTVEKWKQSGKQTNFFDFVCIKELKICCPRNSFGLKCTKCPECGPNEQCLGEGTRAGNGTCVCRAGHTGLDCATCTSEYYRDTSKSVTRAANREESIRVSCKPCHRSCMSCRQEGPLGCDVCRSGFTWLPAHGCSDIDECLRGGKKICGENTFCVNTEGSYFCYECDRACDGCHGDGPDMCLRCASGYKLEKGNCVALKKTILPPEANYYRYAIYAGLCVCTCIILHNNVYLASLVGLGVASYIGVSEYVMTTHSNEMLEHAIKSSDSKHLGL